jgi:hypothetical protein
MVLGSFSMPDTFICSKKRLDRHLLALVKIA